MNGVRVRIGQSLGLQHQLKQRNCQDGFALQETAEAIIGVVCDGCSEGERSEVGATLGAQYLMAQAAQLVTKKQPLREVPRLLYSRLIEYLDNLTKLSNPSNRVDFVRDHLLFTTLILIITEEGALLLSAGDGLLMIDEQIECIDQNNTPFYVAYHLVPDALPTNFQMPTGFQVRFVLEWERLAIGSDGFLAELLAETWGINHVRGLQRKMNVWSAIERRFQDDATLIAVERVKDDQHPTKQLIEPT